MTQDINLKNYTTDELKGAIQQLEMLVWELFKADEHDTLEAVLNDVDRMRREIELRTSVSQAD